MHMNPVSLDADGVLNGRLCRRKAKKSAWFRIIWTRPNGTSRHLHFDVQVFTRDGWLWVNPYVTLISAYERLIRGRGREIGPQAPSASPAMAHALPEVTHASASPPVAQCNAETVSDPDIQDGDENL